MRIYIDTSVVGGYYDKEFDIATIKLFEKVKKGEITLVVSDPMEAELLGAPALVKNHLEEYAKNIEKAALTREAAALADHYIRRKWLVGQVWPIASISLLPPFVKWMY
jgi:predicted nucleic acid-binding protein